jgi:hypothetical protein
VFTVFIFPGFLIRNVLLAGSNFDRQVVPRTANVLILSFASMLVTFGMQFALAWYLWAYLPVNPRNSNGMLSPNPPTLVAFWPADTNGLPKFSVCRTNPVVQVSPPQKSH